MLGYGDIRRTPSGVDQRSWDPDLGVRTARDELMEAWYQERVGRVVIAADVMPTLDLVLGFDDASTFETLVDKATGDGEQWRLLRRETNDHVVVRTNGATIDG